MVDLPSCSAGRAPRREFLVCLLGIEGGPLSVVEDPILAAEPQTTVVAAQPLRPGDEFGAQHPHPIVGLHNLGRHDADVGHIGVDSVDAVGMPVSPRERPTTPHSDRHRPVTEFALPMLMQKKLTVLLPTAFSGQRTLIARISVSAKRWQVLWRMETAAGGNGFRTEP